MIWLVDVVVVVGVDVDVDVVVVVMFVGLVHSSLGHRPLSLASSATKSPGIAARHHVLPGRSFLWYGSDVPVIVVGLMRPH